MYYIDHTLKEWPGDGGLSYVYGTTEYFDLEQEPKIRRVLDGWGGASEEEPGQWTVGDRAGLLYEMEDSEGPVTITLVIADVMPGIKAELLANGEVIGSWEPEKNSECSFVMDSIPAGELQLEIHIINPVSPKELGLSQNESKYGIQVKSLVIRQGDV